MNLSEPRKKHLIIDGHSLLYRAFFGTRFLTTKDGKPTNALYGFINMLLSVMDSEKPYGIVVAFDSPAKTFRHAEYPEYKAHRKEAAPEFLQQIEPAKDMLKSMDIPVIELAGFEADDIVGTIAIQAVKSGWEAVIITGDLDELQLVRDGITVVSTVRGVSEVVRYNDEEVYKKLGVYPNQVVDYKALKGDPSDNIPGIPGIGEKTAVQLIQQFGSLENLLSNLSEVENQKLRDRISSNIEICKISKMLATIITDVPMEYNLQPYRPTSDTIDKAAAFFENLEFRTVKKRLFALFQQFSTEAVSSPAVVSEPEPKFDIIDAPPPEEALASSQTLSMHITNSGLALSPNGKQCYWVSFDWFMPEYVRKALADTKVAKRLYNYKSALTILKDKDSPINGVEFDVVLSEYLLDPSRSSYSADDIVKDHLSLQLPSELEVIDRACILSGAVYHLADNLREKMVAEGAMRILRDIELPVTPILVDMEATGVKVDPEYLQELSSRLAEQMVELEQEVYSIAKHPFNIGSPKQLGDVLFGEMGLPGGKKTKTGAYSTNADLLQQLAPTQPIAKKVLLWRELQKIKGTYADALPGLIKVDGRVHTTFNQTVASTGRLSSQEPNLQNIPIKTEIGREIRRAFVAEDGMNFLSIDYSQIELRLLAHLSGDSTLLDAFHTGQDIHTATASALFGIREPDVSYEQRRQAKTVNYAVLYGMSDYGLSQELGLSVSEAHGIIKSYFERFSGIKAYTESVLQKAREDGYTETLFGRRRYFPELNSGNRMERQAVERAAVNAPIQGTAADLMKLAMIGCADYLRDKRTRILLQVHDELLFECPKDETTAALKSLTDIMESCCKLNVPLKVEARIGDNWRDLKVVNSFES